mgnify:CR=1 FL=1|jgi:saccharopine dehydrogenase-like NADP-dependent oxidoreductase
MSTEIAVLGAGKIGRTIADMLLAAGDYRVTLCDVEVPLLSAADDAPRLRHCLLDAANTMALREILRGKFAVVSALPFHATAKVAAVAVEEQVHYFDLTEDVAATRQIKALAQAAQTALVPQCGLAPGFVSIVASHLAQRFERLDSLRLRTGALPLYPSNSLNYNLTWSTEGVINEYCQPCEAISNGELVSLPALEECEHFSLDGVLYEAFNTSGGLGTLCESFAGRLRELNYRSIRYPGHAAIMKTLLHDLRLRDRRLLLKEILEQAIPTTEQDVVIVFVTASGWSQGQLIQHSYLRKIYGTELYGRHRSAIQIATAAGLCAVLDLLHAGRLPSSGLIRQEDVALGDFLANRFGRLYGEAQPAALGLVA